MQDLNIVLKVQSRHIKRTKYNVCFQYSERIEWMRGACSCMSGLRTVGCCTHVAIIIYLGLGRYLGLIDFKSNSDYF